MAVTSVEPTRESHNDQYPLLMERHDGHLNGGEHVIDIQRGGGEPSSSGSSDFLEFSDGSVRHYHPDGRAVNTTQQLPPLGGSAPGSPSHTNSRSPSFGRRGEGRRNWSPFNSGFWITIEFIFTLSLIIASVTVLWVSRDEHPRAPLFSWVIGYTAGCFASLPILYWRFLHRNQSGDRGGGVSQSSSSSPRANATPGQSSYVSASLSQSPEQEVDHSPSVPPFEGQAHTRCGRVMDHFKMALDCFFVVWFIVGTVWIFGGHATPAEAPNLYRLCIVYLTFSCIGYAMPFILCAMVCCCLPCIISVLGIREELNQVRGASDESISALPTYRFKAQKDDSCTGDPNDEEGGAGGIVAAGTEKERAISGEDAVCCICLTKYMDDEELRELPCTHFFHAECVDRWLKINATCPLCKFEICEREENSTPTPTPGPTPTPSQVQPASET